MRRTSCKAEMVLADYLAKYMGTYSHDNIQPFSVPDMLPDDEDVIDYATLEPNQFVLDGEKHILTENDRVPYISLAMSDENCRFEVNPKINIKFTGKHSSAGLTFDFVDDYPAELKITWYMADGSVLNTKTVHPDALTYVVRETVDNWGEIDIEFVRTRFPYQFAKMQHILYGINLIWSGSQITSANVYEEIDVTSAKLSNNTAKFSILDENSDFDVSNEKGLWKEIQKKQKVTLTEYIDNVPITVGTYYMQEHSFKNNIANFSLVDRIGFLDLYTFAGADYYENVRAGEILESIFQYPSSTEYEIAEDVYNIILTGTLDPGMTSREALQMVCFACGAVAKADTNGKIIVHKPNKIIRYNIPISRKFFQKSNVELKEYVSGIAIEYEKYSVDDKTEELFSGVIEAGYYREFRFDSPYDVSSYSVSGGTVLEAIKTAYSLLVKVSKTGNYVITGKKLKSEEFVYKKEVDDIPLTETENIKSFGTITIYNAETLEQTADYLFDYYSLRQQVSMKYILNAEKVGEYVNIANTEGRTATTLIESQDIDLTGGFLADAECVGYSIVVTSYDYAGELVAGAGGVI